MVHWNAKRYVSVEAMFKAINRFSAPMGKMTASVARMANKGGSSVKQLNTGFDKIGGGLKTVAVAAGAMGVAAGAALVGMAAREPTSRKRWSGSAPCHS